MICLSIVWGYHEYRSIWKNYSQDDEPICRHEVGMLNKSVAGECYTVGYFPRKFSSVCAIFMRHGGAIYCTLSATGVTQCFKNYSMF